MSHAERLIALSSNEDDKAVIQRMHGQPLPKLCGYFTGAGDIDHYRSEPHRLQWTKHGKYDGEHPIATRTFNLSEALGHKPEEMNALRAENRSEYNRISLADYELAKIIEKDLHALGVDAFRVIYRALVRDKVVEQLLLHLPREKLAFDPAQPPPSATGAPEPKVIVPDFEGAVTFLAYLLHKGLVTEKDIPATDPLGGAEQRFANPFGRTMLRFAQSETYQNKVRAGLGEPPLAKGEKQLRDTRL